MTVVHAIYWASQPDLQIHCTGLWTTPAWGGGGGPVFRTIEGLLYSFEPDLITCPACLALQGPPKAPPGRS